MQVPKITTKSDLRNWS